MPVDERAVLVAQRAVDIAAAAGSALPVLRLWELAGGRPEASTSPEPGEPDELGVLLERHLDPDRRRGMGAHFTPPAVADHLVELALVGARDPRAVCDPACGGGAFLLAAARALAARGVDRVEIVTDRLWGADLDPLAVAVAEAALALWSRGGSPGDHLVVADGLLDLPAAWQAAPAFDLVVGNPPFLSQLATVTARRPPQARAIRQRFGRAARAYTDAASLFLVAACDLAAPGGRVALVQPLSMLGARDAAGVRAELSTRARIIDLWVPDRQVFDAAVNVCAPVLEVGVSDRPVRNWAGLLASRQGVPAVALRTCGRVGDDARPAAGFRSEYYGLAPFVRERESHVGGAPLVTAGLIDLGRCAWGERTVRFAKREWRAPVVDVAALRSLEADTSAVRWVERTCVPKVVAATQTRVVEAAVDDTGEWVASVPLIAVPAPSERLWLLAAALCAPAISAWVAQHAAGTARSPRALKLSAGLVADVPLPADLDAWHEGSEALRRHAAGDESLDQFAACMAAAYGLDAMDAERVTDWWRQRL